MNLGTIRNTVRYATAAGMLFAMPLLAQPPQTTDNDAHTSKRRAVRTTQQQILTGRLTDSVTGAGLAEGTVALGNQAATTDAQGFFTLTNPVQGAGTVTITRWGYTSASINFTVTPGVNALNLALVGKPTTSLRDTSGNVHVIDYELGQFSLVAPFTNPQRSDRIKVCSAGVLETIDKANISKIIGPGMQVDDSACCKLGPVVQVTLRMKDGTSKLVGFNDSCYGTLIDFAGRNRVTGEWEYIHFTNIAEIDFP